MITKAIKIAQEAHHGQKDKAGRPYIGHLLRVMQSGNTEDERICGVLHDLVEDTTWTFDDLMEEGFPKHIIEALKCLTKQKNENYDQFIDRVIKNPLASHVKLNDLKDNMDIRRLEKISENDRERLNKYLKAYRKLQSHLNK